MKKHELQIPVGPILFGAFEFPAFSRSYLVQSRLNVKYNSASLLAKYGE